MCDAVCGQILEELREAGREVSGAECCHGATGWHGHGEVKIGGIGSFGSDGLPDVYE